MARAAFSGRVLFQDTLSTLIMIQRAAGWPVAGRAEGKTIDQAATFVRQISDETNDQAYEPTSPNGVGKVRRE